MTRLESLGPVAMSLNLVEWPEGSSRPCKKPQQLQKEDSLSFYSCLMITKRCAVNLHIRNTKLIPPHPSGGITKKTLREKHHRGRRDKAKNELAGPPVVSQPLGNRTRGRTEWRDCLAPTSILATTLVPRWSKREAKVQPCHKGSTTPYTAARPSFPSPLVRSLLAPVVEEASLAFERYR